MIDLDELTVVRCRGCRRRLAVAKRDAPVYCDEMCALDYPASSTEARDSMMELVLRTRDYSYSEVGKMFGFTRQWVQYVMNRRKISPEK